MIDSGRSKKEQSKQIGLRTSLSTPQLRADAVTAVLIWSLCLYVILPKSFAGDADSNRVGVSSTFFVNANCGSDSNTGINSDCGDANGPLQTIQHAIDMAVNSDEIIAAPGTYTEPIDFSGKSITVRSIAGPALTTVDGNGATRVVQCVSGETSATVLSGFTITGGGGMYNLNSNPTVMDCVFTANAASEGGGMHNENSSPLVARCVFHGNSANSNGGGMYNESSSPSVTDCLFTANESFRGGGMYNKNGSPIVTRCRFIGNTVGYSGGGMQNEGGSPSISHCRFAGNTAPAFGGGMNNDTTELTVTNSTFTGNIATQRGGAIASRVTVLTITNCSFYGNNGGGAGGALYNVAASSPDVLNSIMWGNSPQEIFNVSSTDDTPSVSFSIVEGGLGTSTIDAGGNLFVNPSFVDADGPDNLVGTLDDNLRLQPGSPAIDAGDSTAVPAGVTLDLDGFKRFFDDPDVPDTGISDGFNPIVDMGAYEVLVFDGDDQIAFIDCMNGPGNIPFPTPPLTTLDCLIAFDLNNDIVVDLHDAATAQSNLRVSD